MKRRWPIGANLQRLNATARAEQLDRQGHRLIQLGALLFLLTSFEGFAIQSFASPPLARSVHTLAGLSGVILIALGLIWPRLKLSPMSATIAFWSLVYSTFATIVDFLLAAFWRAGSSVIPLAAQGARGTPAEESVLQAIAYTAGPTALIAFCLIVSGLRGRPGSR